MKKITFILALTVFMVVGISAQTVDSAEKSDTGTVNSSTSENKIALDYANYLFEDGFMKGNNAEKIAELSPFLAVQQRESLYSENEQLGVGPFLLNLLLGFGIGSFWQGDKPVGYVQFYGDLIGYGLMIPGLALSLDGNSRGGVLTALGSLLVLGVSIPAYIRPWTFASNRNAKLRRSLNVDANGKALAQSSEKKNGISVSFAPLVLPVSREYGLMARIAM